MAGAGYENGGIENGGNENVSYHDTYNAYMAAQRELYTSRRKREELAKQREESIMDEQTYQEAGEIFRQKQETLIGQRKNYKDALDKEKRDMSKNVVPKAEMAREVYVTEEKPLLEENIEEMEKIRSTNPEEYDRYIEAVDRVMGAEQARRRAETPNGEPWKSPLKEYQELKEAMKKSEDAYNARLAQNHYPRKITSLENLRPEAVKKVNDLLARKQLGSLEELQAQKQALDSKTEERNRKLAEVRLSKKLTSSKEIQKYNSDLVEIMKEKLDEVIGQQKDKLGEIDSVDKLYAEEANIEAAEKEWNDYKNNPDLKLLHQRFSFKNLRHEKEGTRRKIEAEIDKMIDAYPQKEGEPKKPVSSLQEYYDSLGLEQEKAKEIAALEERGVESRKEDLTTILKEGKKWEEVDGLKNGMEEYEAAVRRHVPTMKLPDTFHKLNDMKTKNPVLYKETEKQIDSIISAHLEAGKELGVKNIHEYFRLERRANRLEKSVAEAEQAKRKENDNSASIQEREDLRQKAADARKRQKDVKDKIKEWISEYNKTKKSTKELEAEEKKLVDIVKNHNKAKQKPETEKLGQMKEDLKNLRKANEDKRKFIKYQVIEGTLENRKAEIEKLKDTHEKHREVVASIIKTYNNAHVQTAKKLKGSMFSKDTIELVNNLKKEEKAYHEKLSKINKELSKARKEEKEKTSKWEDSKAKKDYENAIDKQKSEIRALIHKENKNIKRQNEQIRALSKSVDRSFDGYDEHANEEVEKFRNDRLSERKSAYRKAAVKKKVMSALAATLDTVSNTLEKVVLTATEAAIRGEEQTIREQMTEINNQLNNIGAVNMRVLNDSAKRRENLNAEAGQNVGPKKTNLNELAASEVANRNKANEFQEQSNKLAAELSKLNEKLEQVLADQPERLQKNRDSITDIFKERRSLDGERQRRVEAAVHEIDRETAAGDTAKEALAQASYDARMDRLNDLIREDAEASARADERLEELENVSKKLQGMFTEGKLDTIDKVVKVGQVVANFVIDRMNSLSGESSSTEHIDIQQTLKSLEESLQDDGAEPKEHTVETLLNIGKLAFGKVKEVKETVSAQNNKASSELEIAEKGYEQLVEEEKSFETFKEQMAPEMGGNLLEQWNTFYDKSAEKTMEMLDGDIQAAKDNEQKAALRREEAAAKTADLQTKLLNQDEQIKADKAGLSDQKAKLKTAFAENINGKEKIGAVELKREDIFSNTAEDFTFLSKLTGVNMNESMDVDEAMNAFGRIYINGMNAVSYFNLANRWQEASFGDPASPDNQEARSKLVRGLTYFGKEIQDALKAPFGSQEKGRLTGQIIAVENENLTLSPVILSAKVNSASNEPSINTEAIEQFNRNSRMISESFNEVRLAAAEAQKRLDTNPDRRKKNLLAEDLKNEKNLQEWRDQRLAKAVHRSRNTQKDFLAKNQKKDNPPQKSSQPLTRR